MKNPTDPLNSKDDAKLIEMATAGNLDAFNQLVLHYQNVVYNHAFALLGNPDQAEDVTQESFIRAFQAMSAFRGGSFRAWMLKIVTNSAYDLLRRSRRHPAEPLFPEDEYGEEIESPTWLIDPASDVQEIVEQHELSKQVYQALDELPEVFRRGFTRGAVEQVAGAGLLLLASLVDKSLVRHTENGRYDLHEVIRQYAQSHLNENPSQAREARDRHCEYYLDLVAGREKALKSAAQQDAMRELSRELDNIRVAWAWAIEREKFALLGTSIRSLGWMFEVGGLLQEGLDQLELLVQALKAEPHTAKWDRILGAALIHQGLLHFRKGQFDRARKHYEESISVLRAAGEQLLLADALIFSGIILHLDGEYDRSRVLLEEGLAYARAGNDPWFAAFGIYNLGYVDSLMGHYEEGYKQMQAGLEIWRTLGDPHSIALGLNYMVSTLTKLKRYEDAKAAMQESIALCEQTRNRWGMGTAYRFLGLATMAEGQYIEAQAHFRKSIEIFGEDIEGWDIARSLSYLAQATMSLGDLPEAKALYLQALRLATHVDVNALPIAMDSLLGLAQLYASAGDCEKALGFLCCIVEHTSSTWETKERANQTITKTEKYLSHKQIQIIKKKASEQSLEGMMKFLF